MLEKAEIVSAGEPAVKTYTLPELRDEIDEGWLNEIEQRHNLFPDIDYRLYA